MVDPLDFLNDETETHPPAAAPAAAPTPAPRAAAAVPKPADQQATGEDHAAALRKAVDREFSRRRWARADAIARALEEQRQQLEYIQMQPLTKRLAAMATGESAMLNAEITRLEAAHKQALARERAIVSQLKADPISSALIGEEAQATAAERAAIREDAERILAAREAQAEAQHEAARQREREALRQSEQDKEDETPRPSKKNGGAPKPR